MILLGHRHRRHGRRPQPAGPHVAVLRRRHRRVRRRRLASTSSRSRKDTYVERHAARHRLARRPALLVGLAAWQPARPRRAGAAATSCRASSLPDRARARQSRAARLRPLRAASNRSPSRSPAPRCVAVVVRLVAHAPREPREPARIDTRQARTDSLTGLGNRFALHARPRARAAAEPARRTCCCSSTSTASRLQRHLRPPGRRRAADAARLAACAAAAAADGTAYRMGGDEFCVLAAWPADQRAGRADRARRAPRSCEHGDGFTIGCLVRLRAAPRRGRRRRRGAARRRPAPVRREAQRPHVGARCRARACCCARSSEWDAELARHTDDVAALAAQVARRLGLDDDEIERVATAAELHDIGKIAIPRAILQKPGPLDADEWDVHAPPHADRRAHRRTRAPALVGVAELDPLEPRALGRPRLPRPAGRRRRSRSARRSSSSATPSRR